MAIQNYWVNKDELEAQAVRAIKEFLDDCIRSGAFFSSGDNIKDCIGNYVKSKINAASLGFYKFQFDVKLNADIVNGDMGQGPRQYFVVKDYENVAVEMS